jgi:hypothetical protein
MLNDPSGQQKNPVSLEEKQGFQKLRAMADPLLKKASCPAQGHHLGVISPKAPPREKSTYW